MANLKTFGKPQENHLLTQDCVLCGADSQDLLCPDCADDLPRLPERRCPRCALPTPQGETCGKCLAAPPHFDETRVAFRYGFPVDKLFSPSSTAIAWHWATISADNWPAWFRPYRPTSSFPCRCTRIACDHADSTRRLNSPARSPKHWPARSTLRCVNASATPKPRQTCRGRRDARTSATPSIASRTSPGNGSFSSMTS